MTESDKPFDMRRIVPGLTIAFEKIKTDLDITVEPILKNYTGSCPWDAPVGQLSELHHDYNVHGVIGPACSQGLESAGRLAQFLKIPMVTGLGDLLIREPLLGDLYNTLTIVSYNPKKMSCEYLYELPFLFSLKSRTAYEPRRERTNNLHRRKQRRRSAFVFATRIVQFLLYLIPKFQASSLLL